MDRNFFEQARKVEVATCLISLAVALQFFAAQSVYAQSSSPVGSETDWAAVQAAAAAQEAAYKAQEAAANAESAMITAQQKAFGAKYAVDGQTGIAGDVTLGVGTGKPEAIILVSRSALDSADTIYARLKPSIEARPNQSLLVLTAPSDVEAPDAVLFDIKVTLIENAFKLAQAKFKSASDQDPGTGKEEGKPGPRMVGISKLGAITGGLSKLGSYFLSNYTFQAIDSATYPAVSVADHIAGKAKQDFPTRLVQVSGHLLPRDAKLILEPLARLDAQALEVASEQTIATARAAKLREAGKELAAKRYEASDAVATKALEAYNALVDAVAADPKAANITPLFARILRQKKVLVATEANALVLSMDGASAAQLYSKKNLWTFFGGPPVYTTGASTISYALIDPASDGIIASGHVAVHGGYHSIREVQKANAPSK
ncbi:hypothetical protein AB4059_13410 [Lysobacter sp. 2RAF19]